MIASRSHNVGSSEQPVERRIRDFPGEQDRPGGFASFGVAFQARTIRSVSHDQEDRRERQRPEGIDDEVDILVSLQAADGEHYWLARHVPVFLRFEQYRIDSVRNRDHLPGHARKVLDHQVAFGLGHANDRVSRPELPRACRAVQPVKDSAQGRMTGAMVVRSEDQRQARLDGSMAYESMVTMYVNEVEVRGVRPQ